MIYTSTGVWVVSDEGGTWQGVARGWARYSRQACDFGIDQRRRDQIRARRIIDELVFPSSKIGSV